MVEVNHRKKCSSRYPKSCNNRSMEELRVAFKISKVKSWLYSEKQQNSSSPKSTKGFTQPSVLNHKLYKTPPC